MSLRQVKHALSVLVQQHLVFWHKAPEDELVSYEANLPAAYNLLRAGKYVKIAENRVSEFASTIISHLLLLGHARVGDLMQAYGIGYTKDITDRTAAKLGLSERKLSKENVISNKVNGDESVTREKINHTLRELLQAGLVIPVHASNFRSTQDNRMEAELSVGPLAEYKIKGKTKKAIDALWEAEVSTQLHQWNFGGKDEWSEIGAPNVGKKRAFEESDMSPAEKRQRLDLAMRKQDVTSTGAQDSMSVFDDLLKV